MPGNVTKISRKRERYTVTFVELLGKLHSSSTMVGEGIAHGGRVRDIGGREAVEVKVSGQGMFEKVLDESE